MVDNMDAELIAEGREYLDDFSFTEMLIWRVPAPVRGSDHDFKYSLAYVEHNVCVLRFDNEAGKGDHRHQGDDDRPYTFTTLETLIADFDAAVEEWRSK
jgi:hypothetical protein